MQYAKGKEKDLNDAGIGEIAHGKDVLY